MSMVFKQEYVGNIVRSNNVVGVGIQQEMSLSNMPMGNSLSKAAGISARS